MTKCLKPARLEQYRNRTILGKMFPCVCYRDEADWMTRLALSLGMCPRGEVGAGIIVRRSGRLARPSISSPKMMS